MCSVPPFRLKRWAVPAFMIIATVRGFLLNFGVYYATRAAIGLPEFTWSPAIACALSSTLHFQPVPGFGHWNLAIACASLILSAHS